MRWKGTEGRLVRLDDQEDLRVALREMVVDKKAAAGEGRLEVIVSMPDAGNDIGDIVLKRLGGIRVEKLRIP